MLCFHNHYSHPNPLQPVAEKNSNDSNWQQMGLRYDKLNIYAENYKTGLVKPQYEILGGIKKQNRIVTI